MAPSKATQEKIAKACKAMKPFGVSAETVKSVLKRLLKLYEKNWMYIEEENYRVLIEAIFEPQDNKTNDMNEQDFNLRDESEEEAELASKKPRLINQRISPLSDSNSSPSLNQYSPGKQHMVDTDIETSDILGDHQGKGKKPVLPSQVPLAVIYPDGSSIGCCFNTNENASPEHQLINLDATNTSSPRHLCENTSSSKSLAIIQGTDLLAIESRNMDTEENTPVLSKIEGQLQIPRSLVSSSFDHLHHISGLNFHRNCFGGRSREPLKLDNIDGLSGSSSLAIVPLDPSSFELCDNHYCVADITHGLEKRKISLINEFNNQELPAFTYIPENVNYKSANVKFMLARISDENCCSNCIDDCLSSEVPCACAAETGGEFAYTVEGSIKENFLKSCISINQNPTKDNYFYCENCPLERMKEMIQDGSCRGHVIKKFIKECWYKCGCGLNCGNRVVQRGIKANLQVFMTPEGKGWGLRTLEDLPRGAFVCEYVGEIVTNIELYYRNEQNKDEKHTYPVLLDADWGSEGFLKDEEALCLDATSFGNVARFINHRCLDANLMEIPVEVESPDHHYYHHAFFTTREVKAMEELTWDYSIDFFDDNHPVKAFHCKCGSKLCRDVKLDRRTKRGHGQRDN